MAELPPGPRLFAVAMQMGAGDREDRRSVRLLPDHVHHRNMPTNADVAERQPADRAEVILELTGLGALDRPVAWGVDARRRLVAWERPAPLEQLDREDADVAEPIGHRSCMGLRG